MLPFVEYLHVQVLEGLFVEYIGWTWPLVGMLANIIHTSSDWTFNSPWSTLQPYFSLAKQSLPTFFNNSLASALFAKWSLTGCRIWLIALARAGFKSPANKVERRRLSFWVRASLPITAEALVMRHPLLGFERKDSWNICLCLSFKLLQCHVSPGINQSRACVLNDNPPQRWGEAKERDSYHCGSSKTQGGLINLTSWRKEKRDKHMEPHKKHLDAMPHFRSRPQVPPYSCTACPLHLTLAS